VRRHPSHRASEVLDHLPTAHTVSSSKETCDGTRSTRIRETLFALTSDRIEGGFAVEEVEYRILLDADGMEYAAARKTLIKVAESFRRLPARK
jgi:hypothetical protein